MKTNPPSDDRQIRRQATLASEPAKNSEIILDDLKENLGSHIFDVGGSQRHSYQLGSALDYVKDQSQKLVNKSLPSAGFVTQAALQQNLVGSSAGHGFLGFGRASRAGFPGRYST
jgi:hypothetical protein